MGLYPERDIVRTSTPEGTFLTVTRTEPGLVTTERFVLASTMVERDNCFCCSCDENDLGGLIADPACRNHGFAATRPCEVHGMPGSVWDDLPNDDGTLPEWCGTMPESVQEIRRQREAATA